MIATLRGLMHLARTWRSREDLAAAFSLQKTLIEVEAPRNTHGQAALGQRAFGPTTSGLGKCLTLCLVLLCTLAGTSSRAQITYAGGAVDLGSVNIGASASTTITFNVAAGQTGTVISVSAVSLGNILQDFSIPSQTCVGATLNGPATCTVTVAFSPSARGTRRGALIVTANNQPNVTVYLHGIGVGSQLVFSPDTASSTGTVTPLQPVYYSPSSVVFDAAGNLYFNDFLNGRILEQSASGTLATVVALPGNIMSSLALSGDGTIFATVPPQAAVYAIVPGVAPNKVAITFTGVTLNRPSGIAVDNDGSLYIADSGSNKIIHSTTAGAATYLTLTGLNKALSGPEGIVLDGAGNLFIADSGNQRIVEVNLATGAATPVTITGASLYNPYGITIDASGTLYIADTGNRRIVRVLPTGAGSAVLTSNFSFSSPTGVTVAANGDLIVADNNDGLTRIYRTSPTPTITFGTTTTVGTLDSADGPLPVTLQNIGNAPLQLVVPGTGNSNPKTSTTAFALAPTSTCPLVASTTTTANAQIAAGTSCTYAVTFTPAVAGTNTGTLNIVTRPTGSTTNVTSTVTLTGTGAATTTPVTADSFTITAPTTATAGTPVSFNVTAMLNGAVATGYTGTVALSTNDATAVFGAGTTYTFTAADAGTHTFTAPGNGITFNTPGTYQISATDGTNKGVSNNIVVSAKTTAANTIAFTITPTATVGVADAFALTVTQNGATNTAYRGTVTLSSTDPAATFPGGTTYTFTAADAGTHLFSAGIVFGTVGTFAVNATDGTATGTTNVIVSAGGVAPVSNTLTLTISPTATVGTADQFTLTVTQNGVVNNNYRGTVTFNATDPLATFPGGTSYTFTAADQGSHHFPLGVIFGSVGTFTVSASDGTAFANANVVVSPAGTTPPATNTLAFIITPTATVGVGDSFTLNVTQNGVPNTAYVGTVTFSSTDPAATFPGGTTYTFTAADAGSHTFPVGVVFGTAGTFTVNATDGTANASATVVVSAATNPTPTNTLAFTITPTATIGVADAFTLSVTQNGAPATAYRGTVTFNSTDPAATFPGGTTYTFTTADAGTHTFPTGVVFGTAGTFAVNATDGTANATANVVVSPATTTPPVVNTFAITTTPTATVGVPDAFTLTVTQNGVAATGFTGTVTLSSTDPLATFPGGTTYTFTAADAGTHTFPTGVVFGTVGTFTIHATDGTAAATANVVVSAANMPPPVVNTLVITTTPTATVGVADAFTISVTQNGVAATAYRGTVTLSSTDPLATFPGGKTYTFTAADAGTHTFATGIVFGTVGTFTIQATDGTAAATANVVVSAATVTPPVVNTFTITTTPTAAVGVPDAFTISVTQNGVAATGYIGTVTLSSTDPLATFPGGTTYTFTAADAGTHTFATGIVFGTIGTFTIHATDGTTAATTNVVVSAATVTPPPVVNTFVITTTPTATVGVADAFTISVTQNGVAATGYTGTITLSSTDPLATFPGGTAYTFTAADAGTHTFTNGIVFGTVGTFTIHATDGTTVATANVVVSAAGTPGNPTLITPTIALTSSANPVSVGAPTTLTAVVTGTQAGGAATGTIGFYDNGNLLGTVATTTGTAALPGVTFTTTGTHNLTAIYSGSTVYNPVTSAILVETVGDISLTLTPNTSGSITVLPGNSATFSFTVTPANNGTFVLPVTLSATGAPTGSVITFTPTSIAAGAAATTFTLNIAVPATSAALHQPPPIHPSQPMSFGRIAPVAFALTLLPILARRRRKPLLPLLALLGLTFGSLGLTGCLTDQASGYFGQTPHTYTIVVSATSGGTTRSTTVTLIVQ